MKQWLKKITGIADLEDTANLIAARLAAEEKLLEEAVQRRQEAEREEEMARRREEEAKISPKDRATRKGEPWICVLDVKVNEDNIRNGFFELDWNVIFVQELIRNGYGTTDDPEEEVVDRWFRDIVVQMLEEENLDIDRGMGYINITPINGGTKSEIS
jgi:hypothetical protein